MILKFWTGVAAVMFLVCLAVHASTFLGIDPLDVFPGVMWIHLVLFFPFIAALIYAERVDGPKEKRQEVVMAHAPRWLYRMCNVFFVYCLINFALFMFLNEGGGPEKRDGRYVLASHGHIIRELTEQEFHQQQAYEVRGFSGHWMMFFCAAWMLLAGVARLRREDEAMESAHRNAEGYGEATTTGPRR